MKKSMYIAAFICLSIILSACGSKAEEAEGPLLDETFTIGVIPAQTVGAMEEAMDKLQSLLSEELNRKVTVDVYPDYNGVVEALNYDKIDMAYLGPLTYIIANQKSGAKAIITQEIDGKPYYHSYIITYEDEPWESLEDLLHTPEEVDFAFGDPNSTSGSLIPTIELQKRGVFDSQEDHDFHSVRYTGSHDATALAVQNKQINAGAIDSAIYHQLIESGKIDKEQLKVIWKSEELFQYPWAVHKDTNEETITRLQETFLSIEDEEILEAFGASGFTKASKEDYRNIEEAAKQQGIINE
ncbi:phosphate/phosphite/phosphonate ABC transporter substrate-binding protein [Virgibacillus sediminis]|uniref:Phosphate/phosphite/phosphonate ABC transporter substrate-binding protein n=1 Tax=Virgibacillus sediminis TaxID=202260 RepID=A0ABV7AAL0_9BACI